MEPSTPTVPQHHQLCRPQVAPATATTSTAASNTKGPASTKSSSSRSNSLSSSSPKSSTSSAMAAASTLTSANRSAYHQHPALPLVQGGDEIKVNIATLLGTKHELKIYTNETLSMLKIKIAKMLRMPPEDQQLLFAGKDLTSFSMSTIKELGLTDNSTITLAPALRSGPSVQKKQPPPVIDQAVLMDALRRLTPAEYHTLVVKQQPLKIITFIGEQMVEFTVVPYKEKDLPSQQPQQQQTEASSLPSNPVSPAPVSTSDRIPASPSTTPCEPQKGSAHIHRRHRHQHHSHPQPHQPQQLAHALKRKAPCDEATPAEAPAPISQVHHQPTSLLPSPSSVGKSSFHLSASPATSPLLLRRRMLSKAPASKASADMMETVTEPASTMAIRPVSVPASRWISPSSSSATSPSGSPTMLSMTDVDLSAMMDQQWPQQCTPDSLRSKMQAIQENLRQKRLRREAPTAVQAEHRQQQQQQQQQQPAPSLFVRGSSGAEEARASENGAPVERVPKQQPASAADAMDVAQSSASSASRCAKCSRKLGLVNAYSCRCKGTFCSSHRHSDCHDCSFDYKSFGKQQLIQANPPLHPSKV